MLFTITFPLNILFLLYNPLFVSWYIICSFSHIISSKNGNMNRTLVEKREKSATEERVIAKNVWLVAPGVWRMKDIFVNVYIIQNREGTEWILVDAGLKTSASKIKSMAEDIYGSRGARPKAIIMTHGHFDHRGSLIQLADEWGVPVYCHHMERPYLTGKSSYPPADPGVGGGMMALLSFTYPRKPINIEDHLRELPENGMIDELEDWRWIHTPGHTPGHISLFREKDGVLIAGDAFVTTMQESVLAVATQKKYVCGPPKYFTPDWGTAARSVRELAALEPNVIATGHGQAMYGDEARKELHKLSRDFWKWGMPAAGRYVTAPAEFDEHGVPTHIPKAGTVLLKRLATAAALFAIGYILVKQSKKTTGWQRKGTAMLGKQFKTAAVAAVGATAAASPALPAVPLIPAI
jgi:glyoxylase-like metal-dependent hydrolase (beta-lactamase superfamily II)